jgi:hypothetical protein
MLSFSLPIKSIYRTNVLLKNRFNNLFVPYRKFDYVTLQDYIEVAARKDFRAIQKKTRKIIVYEWKQGTQKKKVSTELCYIVTISVFS